MKRNYIMLILGIFMTLQSFSQTTSSPCSAPESAQFDFWVGNWNLTWNDTSHGTNRIEKILGTCVVQENFESPSDIFSERAGACLMQQPKNGNKHGWITKLATSCLRVSLKMEK